MKKDDLFKLNLYEQLNISQTATQSEIGKAYRKKALKVHPDKNPGNSKAEDDFKFLTFILNILNDKQTRESYDLVLNGRKRRCEANERLDDERKKFKNDLEKREEAARRKDEEKKEMKRFETQEKYFRQQVDKIEKENEDLLNEMKRKLLEEQQDVTRIVRTFKWKYKSDEMDNKNRKWSKRMLKAVLFSSVDLKHHERINKRSYKCSFNSKKSLEMFSRELSNNLSEVLVIDWEDDTDRSDVTEISFPINTNIYEEEEAILAMMMGEKTEQSTIDS